MMLLSVVWCVKRSLQVAIVVVVVVIVAGTPDPSVKPNNPFSDFGSRAT